MKEIDCCDIKGGSRTHRGITPHSISAVATSKEEAELIAASLPIPFRLLRQQRTKPNSSRHRSPYHSGSYVIKRKSRTNLVKLLHENNKTLSVVRATSIYMGTPQAGNSLLAHLSTREQVTIRRLMPEEDRRNS